MLLEHVKHLTVNDFAKREGVSTQAVRMRLCAGKLRGRKIGRDWFVEADQKMPGQGARSSKSSR